MPVRGGVGERGHRRVAGASFCHFLFLFFFLPRLPRRGGEGVRRGGGLEAQIVFWQARVRTPWLDTYFLQTSMLGTHTFFLVFLPAFFFFGHDGLGRG